MYRTCRSQRPNGNMVTLLRFFVTYTMCLLTSGAEEKELRLLGLQPMSGEAWPGGWACLVPVRMAVERINEHPDLLKGYTLKYEYIDHECIPGTAVFKMAQMLNTRPPYVMVLGPILSSIAASTAQVLYHWNLTQLGLAAASPLFSDRERYPRFYRLSPPDKNLNWARISLFKQFNWNRVATIHHAEESISMAMVDFFEALQAENITIVSQQVFLNDPTIQLQTLKDQDARIIMASMYDSRARAVLCGAYKIGLYGHKIVWLFHGYLSTTFWRVGLDSVDCTAEEMDQAAEGIFLIKLVDRNPVEERGISNLTIQEFVEEFRSRDDYNPETQEFDNIGGDCFDGTWMSALALNCTVAKLEETGHPKTLDQFTYMDYDINKIIYECLGNTSITGVAGRSYFPEDGDPVRLVKIERVQGHQRCSLGYQSGDGPSPIQWIEGALKWKNGMIPRDSTRIIEKEQTIPKSIYATMCVLSVFGILLSVFFLGFNVSFRTNRTVKMSSPNINNAMLVGCILSYSSVFIKSIEVTVHILCTLKMLYFCLGVTVVFGSLFSKTWRVYRLFTKKNLQMPIKDSQLFAINGAIVAMVLLVLIIWESIAPHTAELRFLKNEVYTIGNDEEVHPYVQLCWSSLSTYFHWTICIIEGLLLAFSAFLAWQTRNVNIVTLNDSRHVGLCVYNAVIISAIGLTLTLLLEDQHDILYGVTSGCLITGTTLTQLLLFVPKVYTVYKSHVDPSPAPVPKASVAHKSSGPGN